MPLNKIQDTDKLKDGTDKINKAIDLTNALKLQSDDAQDQLVKIMTEGVEVKDESVNKKKFTPQTKDIIVHDIENKTHPLGVTNWIADNSTLSMNNGRLITTGTGGVFARTRSYLTQNPSVGDIIFFRVKAKVENGDATNIRILIRNGNSGTIFLNHMLENPSANVEYDILAKATITEPVSNIGMSIVIDHLYSGSSAGKRMEISFAFVENLTKLYPLEFIPSTQEFKVQMDQSLNLFKASDVFKRVMILEKKGIELKFNTEENVNSSIVEFIEHPNGDKEYKTRDVLKYPQSKVWGHEYLYGWYKKIAEDENLVMTWAGDSTTANSGISDVSYHRNNLGKKILTLGGYESEKITSLNRGFGGRHTGDWLADYLDGDIASNPDLLVLGYGLNDGGTNYFPGTTITQRVQSFEQRLREGLGRIRRNHTFPSGASYNRNADQLSIIICTPVSTNNENNSRTPEKWHNYIRPVIQKACRDFQCAFVDLAAHQYDRKYSSAWSTSGDNVHPDHVSTADYMSVFKDILMPYTLQK
ncbi:SGNH/GDSL hydrolase family protein [Alkalicoccobacillus porphyridii]|uniref:SGNH/GDSL hydrolase family protein n=1 Tax=Alkalicoccobacillus porphyridii TaxID=2597270 RepID=A0A554A0A3_9BACI|nr:SGNH/GDSL hydrolase family protein [Alkalicoccobacillus porphyridii]TSB47121.1 SGNH/GDSL hydrolase family protein [Alkalicoccobacillus porphyridii]